MQIIRYTRNDLRAFCPVTGLPLLDGLSPAAPTVRGSWVDEAMDEPEIVDATLEAAWLNFLDTVERLLAKKRLLSRREIEDWKADSTAAAERAASVTVPAIGAWAPVDSATAQAMSASDCTQSAGAAVKRWATGISQSS